MVLKAIVPIERLMVRRPDDIGTGANVMRATLCDLPSRTRTFPNALDLKITISCN